MLMFILLRSDVQKCKIMYDGVVVCKNKKVQRIFETTISLYFVETKRKNSGWYLRDKGAIS